jgi:hypothetical protein
MIGKLGVLLLCGLSIAVVAIMVGRSTKVLVVDRRAVIFSAVLAILILVYLYWKSRPT